MITREQAVEYLNKVEVNHYLSEIRRVKYKLVGVYVRLREESETAEWEVVKEYT